MPCWVPSSNQLPQSPSPWPPASRRKRLACGHISHETQPFSPVGENGSHVLPTTTEPLSPPSLPTGWGEGWEAQVFRERAVSTSTERACAGPTLTEKLSL